ncbi:MAG: CoA transferase [Pseudomonadales bacterium]|nr:CoA transferase [Pseudomonadales bacterium]
MERSRPETMLKNIRIVDLTSVVLGPYATMMLADLGAEVIKIESPAGDVMRYADPARSRDMGAVFLNTNRGKKSLAIDLKDSEARELLLRLCESADVFVHSMRPKAIMNLGLTYESIKRRRENIIYCSAWGFDQAGPMKDAPAYDDIIQSASGLAHLNGHDGDSPRYVPSIMADKITGLFATNAILAAIFHRLKTGEGQSIEVPMMECLSSFMLLEHLAGEVFEPANGSIGYARMLSKSRRPYATKDGFIGVLPYTAKHWQRFLKEIKRSDLAELAWVQDDSLRSQRIDELYTVVEKIMPSRTTNEWESVLTQIDIPHTKVNSLSDLLNDSQLSASKLFEEYEHPSEGRLKGTRPPVRHFSDRIKHPREVPSSPKPGAHTQEILENLGLSDAKIFDLFQRGVINKGM